MTSEIKPCQYECSKYNPGDPAQTDCRVVRSECGTYLRARVAELEAENWELAFAHARADGDLTQALARVAELERTRDRLQERRNIYATALGLASTLKADLDVAGIQSDPVGAMREVVIHASAIESERDDLRARVAEQQKEIERLGKAIDILGAERDSNDAEFAELHARCAATPRVGAAPLRDGARLGTAAQDTERAAGNGLGADRRGPTDGVAVRIRIEETFAAAHRLPQHTGNCHNLHGHTYLVVVEFSGNLYATSGWVLDFREAREIVRRALPDHRLILWNLDELWGILRDVEGCKILSLSKPPTAETLALHIAERIEFEIGGRSKGHLERVEVWESPTTCAIWERDTGPPRVDHA